MEIEKNQKLLLTNEESIIKILIVEDERIVAMDLNQTLISLGYSVVGIAKTGDEAVRLAGEKTPDLILMDVKIKGVMDGIETVKKINSFLEVPVIYLTAFADEDTLQRAKQTEPFGYLLKPYDKRGLHTTIEMALYKYKMEKRLKSNERWLSTILNSMGDAMITIDIAGSIVFLNPAAESFIGWKQSEVHGKNLDGILTINRGSSGQKYHNILDQVKNENKRIILNNNTYLLDRSGNKKYLFGTASPLIDEKNNLTGVVMVFQDITEQKKIQDELKYSEERFEKAFRASPHAVIINRYSDGQVTEVNNSFEKLSQYKQKELDGEDFKLFTFFKYEKTGDKIVQILQEKGMVRELEAEIKRKSGEERLVNISIEKIELNGETHLLTILEDITERKKDEEVREKLFKQVIAAQERLKIVSRKLMEVQELERRKIARELHDEIGQILTAVKINLQMTQNAIDSPDTKPDINESIELTEEALKQVRNLSLDLRPSMLDDLGLVPALRWYVDRQSQRTGINARVIAEPIKKRLSPHIEVTCYRITQEALTNVIRHAGEVGQVKVELWLSGNELNLKISDDGKGFDVYSALQKSLSGKSMGILGMQERVELVGGTLKINSKAGKGTEIHAIFQSDKS